MFTKLSSFFFRPTRAMLEERILDLTERLRHSEVKRKLIETERISCDAQRQKGMAEYEESGPDKE